MRACGVEVEVLGGQNYLLFNYPVGPLWLLPGLGRALSLPLRALPPSLSDPPRERAPLLPSPLRGSPLLASASPPPPPPHVENTPRPSCKGGRRPGGQQLRLGLRGRWSPDVIAHCISIKQSILDMECSADG
ncbi:hypothetical protein GHT09_020159 [Marmota monax]|uniref:Uncharacterized protein n=1 Tax=Marmota monax TaxID=9995 RepID=A0A834PZE3_MARMO|nr:hypothetical protein GHT09_020159 [Marmota monax]